MRILPHFPMLMKLSQIIEKFVERVIEEERNRRQDLFVLATSYIGQLKTRSNDMMKEADFHQISDKPAKTPSESTKTINGNGNNVPIAGVQGKSKKFLQKIWFKFLLKSHYFVTLAEIKETIDRVEKKSSSTSVTIKQSSSTSLNSSVEKESKRELRERESTEKNFKEKSSSKESKRDKDENDGGRKRERGEKRRERERKAMSSPTYIDPVEPYPNEQFEERERDRDLSSISNSSNGSTNRRSQESPDHDRGNLIIKNYMQIYCKKQFNFFFCLIFNLAEMKRRKVDKKNNDDLPLIPDENVKRERSSTKSKDKRDKSSYGDIDVRKDKRVSRKRAL